MHADDTNYTTVKNGVVVVSGTGPAIRVDGNRPVIRDGPQETQPLVLTRAEASKRLRHVVVCGHAGGLQSGSSDLLGMRKGIGRQTAHVLFEGVC